MIFAHRLRLLAWGNLSDDQLELVFMFIENNVALCDTIGG